MSDNFRSKSGQFKDNIGNTVRACVDDNGILKVVLYDQNGDVIVNIPIDIESYVQPVTSTTSAFTVTTSAQLIRPSDTGILSWAVVNNGTGNLFIGYTSSVATSGANMGIKIAPGGAIAMAAIGTYTGEIYGIYSAAAATQNVVVTKQTTSV